MLLQAVLVAVLAVLVSPLLTRWLGRNAGWLIAVLLVAAAMLIVLPGGMSATIEQSTPWVPSLGIGLHLRLDGLSLAFALLVLLIGAAVMVYSTRYLGGGGHGSFYLTMSAFAMSMLVLVLADDLVVMFVAWEATTFCSFFLIARSGPAAREPAIRTLLVTFAGGLALLGAVTVTIVGTGTARITEVLGSDAWSRNPGMTVAVAVLLAVAAFTKSAQFPFQAWLPDSMVAITPISAYLHAAAMVKAGIYLLLRFSPVFAEVPVWNVLLVASGLVTALFASFAALRRHDLKELLAYSTVSQLGLIVVLVGVGTEVALTAAVVHTIAHALFKSALFMLVGVVDHEAGTRDIRELAGLRLRMPVTAVSMTLAAASMAGIPPLLGFISKEGMFAALLDAPGAPWIGLVLTIGVAVTATMTFAYSGRMITGAFGGRAGRQVPEAAASFWIAPALGAFAGLLLGLAPFTLNELVSSAGTAVAATPIQVDLLLWHGVNTPLVISLIVIALGTLLIVQRRRVETLLAPMDWPWSGLDVVDWTRRAIIRVGESVGAWAGSRAPKLHLTIPAVCLIGIAVVGVFALDDLPPVAPGSSRPLDWVLVLLVAAGVAAAVRARTRVSAVLVTGIAGFAMTVWFLVLGATDVALTQLMVEILTVCVMVLLLRRLPARFSDEPRRGRAPAMLMAVGAGVATTLGVWALTGRRDASEAANYYVTEGESITGGANVVNTILVDFRALDTMGELTVLAIAGVAIAALLHGRDPSPIREAAIDRSSPLAPAGRNTVFIRTAAVALVPAMLIVSALLFFRGHQEPGGGFIAALVAGAVLALLYLAAPSDAAAPVRFNYMVPIGLGIIVAVGTGFLGYLEGSFLAPLHVEIVGVKLTSTLVFDAGVYLAVLGIILAAFNLLGLQRTEAPAPHRSAAVREEAR